MNALKAYSQNLPHYNPKLKAPDITQQPINWSQSIFSWDVNSANQ